jgi:glycine cleavage system H lipoate-binding protein
MYPENFRYTKEHEWVLADGDSGTVGITDHAQQELGDIVYVDLPKVGSRIDAWEVARLSGEREGGVRHLLAGLGRDH